MAEKPTEIEVDKPENLDDDGKKFTIYVNTEPHVVEDDEVTYKQIVELSGNELKPEVTYLILWSKGGGREESGKLAPGGKVKIKDGTEFDVGKAGRV